MKNEKGSTLIEVVIALGLLGIIAAAYLGSLGNASKSLATADERATAESLARSQMECIKDGAYHTDNYSAPPIPPEYTAAGYTTTITFEVIKADLERIKITVVHNSKPIITSGSDCTLEGYKGN